MTTSTRFFDRAPRLIFLMFLFGANAAFAQFFDDFSDGNFTQNPAWQGDVANFKVNLQGELQLNAPAAGQSVLLVQSKVPDSAVWDMRFRLEFAASTSNLLRILLMLDGPDPNTANGYHIEIGENGNVDALKLYRQKGAVRTLLASGASGLAGKDTVTLRVRVKRSLAGFWTMEAARDCPSFESQMSPVQDSTYKPGVGLFFGFLCKYTDTRKDKFYFDELSLDVPKADQKPPLGLLAVAEDSLRLRLDFDEPVDTASAKLLGNYLVSNGIGQPVDVTFNPCNTSVFLQLQKSLATSTYNIDLKNIKDAAGNAITTQTLVFQYLKIEAAAEYDILFNEIMADPTPRRGLPDAEWLELYNRSQKHIQLSTLRLGDGMGAAIPLPNYLMKPNEYVLLAAPSKADSLRMNTAATVLSVPISITELKNEGDIVVLKTAANVPIDLVEYTLDWYADEAKKDGGWSLERIDPTKPCLGRANWQACPNFPSPGGTPGTPNRSLKVSVDVVPPRMIAAFPISASLIEVTFSEGLDQSAWNTPSAWRFSPNIAVSKVQSDFDRSIMQVSLAQPMQPRVRYDLTVAAAVRDCAGNAVSVTDTVSVGLAEKPEKQDIVINEILFNPPTGGARYLEVYNRSNKIFNWQEFVLSGAKASGSVEDVSARRLIFPGEYHVFCPNPFVTADRFDNIIRKNFLQQILPSINDERGEIVLSWSKNGDLVQVDSFYYDEGFHNALLNDSDREGVALERIRSESPTNDANNWTSASSIKTGAAGTPTLPNSQRATTSPDDASGLIQLSSDRISPDDDGFEDYLDMTYSLPKEGYAASLYIFDANGQLVKNMVRQDLLGTDGALRWDGDLDDGTRARVGIYVLFLEIFSPEGDVKKVKKAVAVVKRF